MVGSLYSNYDANMSKVINAGKHEGNAQKATLLQLRMWS